VFGLLRGFRFANGIVDRATLQSHRAEKGRTKAEPDCTMNADAEPEPRAGEKDENTKNRKPTVRRHEPK